MNLHLGLIGVLGFATAAHGQAPTASYVWQVSDGDSGWGPSCLSVGSLVHVRLLAYWTGIPDGLGVGYSGGQFDAILQSEGAVGTVSNISRPAPFNFSAQTLVASTIANGLKIDTSADLAAPGAGAGWINPGQAPAAANPFGFNSVNGAVVFSFDVFTRGNAIIIDMVLNGAIGRSMAVYSNEIGTQIRIDDSATAVSVAWIYVPTPGTLALLGISALTATRRHRIFHSQI